jgi:hypothetical protein
MEELLLYIRTVSRKRPRTIHCKSPLGNPNTYLIAPNQSNYVSTIVSKHIRDWNACLDNFFNGLRSDFSRFVSAQQIASSVPQAFFQDVLARAGIKSAQTQLETWLGRAHPVRVIGVYGITGFEKTPLLKTVYNIHEVSKFCHIVSWFALARDC